MTKKFSHKIIAGLTCVCFLMTQLLSFETAAAQMSVYGNEIIHPSGFSLTLPSEIGTIEAIRAGNGSLIIHIQEAHGNPEGQESIRRILHHLRKNYGVNLVLLEGSAFKLHPELLRFYPDDPKRNQELWTRLMEKGLLTGPEFYLGEDPTAEAYGIEEIQPYVQNGRAFVDVLNARNHSREFLSDLDLQIERLISTQLNLELKQFLRQADQFESKFVSLEAWLAILKKAARENLRLNLEDPREQIDWPMMLRIFTLKRLEKDLDVKSFKQEKNAFLIVLQKFISKDKSLYEQIEKILHTAALTQSFSDPETELLFESMVELLPQDFPYQRYPNVNRFIGHMILQSELTSGGGSVFGGKGLIGEMETLQDKILEKLAKESFEKEIVGILKDYKLLKNLFALELTPDDYEKVLKRLAEKKGGIRPGEVVQRFANLNQDRRFKDIDFKPTRELEPLFDKALEFYRLARERDGIMIRNIEKRLQEAGKTRAVVITGGFHAKLFEEVLSQNGFSYVRITPRMTHIDGSGKYSKMVLETFSPKIATFRRAELFALKGSQLKLLGYDPDKVLRQARDSGIPLPSREIPARDPLSQMGVRPLPLSSNTVSAVVRSEARGGIAKKDLPRVVHEFAVKMKAEVSVIVFNSTRINIKKGELTEDTLRLLVVQHLSGYDRSHRFRVSSNQSEIIIKSATQLTTSPAEPHASFLQKKKFPVFWVSMGALFLAVVVFFNVLRPDSTPDAKAPDTNTMVSTIESSSPPRTSIPWHPSPSSLNQVPSSPTDLTLEQIYTNKFINPYVQNVHLSVYGLRQSLELFGSAKNWINVDTHEPDPDILRTNIVRAMQQLLGSFIWGSTITWPTNSMGETEYWNPYIYMLQSHITPLPRDHPLGETFASMVENLRNNPDELYRIYEDPSAAAELLNALGDPGSLRESRPLTRKEEEDLALGAFLRDGLEFGPLDNFFPVIRAVGPEKNHTVPQYETARPPTENNPPRSELRISKRALVSLLPARRPLNEEFSLQVAVIFLMMIVPAAYLKSENREKLEEMVKTVTREVARANQPQRFTVSPGFQAFLADHPEIEKLLGVTTQRNGVMVLTSSASETHEMNRIFDIQTSDRMPDLADMAARLLSILNYPNIEYHLLVIGTPAQVSDFKTRLSEFLIQKIGIDLLTVLQGRVFLRAVSSIKGLHSEIRIQLSNKQQPTAVVGSEEGMIPNLRMKNLASVLLRSETRHTASIVMVAVQIEKLVEIARQRFQFLTEIDLFTGRVAAELAVQVQALRAFLSAA